MRGGGCGGGGRQSEGDQAAVPGQRYNPRCEAGGALSETTGGTAGLPPDATINERHLTR